MKCLVVYATIFIATGVWAGRANFKVLVLDGETGSPVSGIKIEGSFLNYSKGWGVAAKDNDVDAITDAHGIARLSGSTEKGSAGYRIYGNTGYYNAEWVPIIFREQSLLKLGAWQPSDIVLTTRLDRVINPIPLFVKKSFGAYRENNQQHFFLDADYGKFSTLSATNDVPKEINVTMAYDLCKGMWLPPYGDGKVADILFACREVSMGWEGYRGGGGGISMYRKFKTTVTISFPGNGNGVCDCVPAPKAGIKLRTAPLNGYMSSIERWKGWFGGETDTESNCDKNRCSAFRIRTVYDEHGNIKSALYGKIYGDFDLSSREGVGFLYYLNPTPNDRNLEWDMQNNLFPRQSDSIRREP